MKAEHRHELKTNELAEWIFGIPQWARDNIKIIAYAGMAVVLAAGWTLWHLYDTRVQAVRQKAQLTELIGMIGQVETEIVMAGSEGTDASYRLLQVANNLQATALKASQKPLAAFALIKRGQALRAELQYRSGSVSQSELEGQIEPARASYRQALEKAGTDPTLVGMAKMGLGLCAEDLGQYDRAAEIYGQIITDPQLAPTVAGARARRRLATMDDYRGEVVFTPEPEPNPEDEVQGQDGEEPIPAPTEPAETQPAAPADESAPADTESPGGLQDPNGER